MEGVISLRKEGTRLLQMLYIVESLERFLLFTKGSHPVSKYKDVLEVISERPVTILAVYNKTFANFSMSCFVQPDKITS